MPDDEFGYGFDFCVNHTIRNFNEIKTLGKSISLLAIVALCLFSFALQRQCDGVWTFEMTLLEFGWGLLICLVVWCGAFLVLLFSPKDLLMIGLLLIAMAMHSITAQPPPDAITLLFGATLGKGMRFALQGGKRRTEKENISEIANRKLGIRNFLIGLVMLLVFSSWWHLHVLGAYHGPRWMGLWDNPNIYGMLMGVGVMLAIGLLAQMNYAECRVKNKEVAEAESRRQKTETLKELENGRKVDENEREEGSVQSGNRILSKDPSRRFLLVVLFIAAGMLAVGLLFSYSRGAWLGTVISLLYLARVYGKLKWRPLKCFLFSVFCFLLLSISFFWNTPRMAPWYFQRMDLSRGSVQHRVAAWKAAFEIMRDHPFGVGWNNVVETYREHYSPPADGAFAITMNDYLMLGTQLGIPALLCFVVYVALCFRGRPHLNFSPPSPPDPLPPIMIGKDREQPSDGKGWNFSRSFAAKSVTCNVPIALSLDHSNSSQPACRAGALAMLVSFWFDGGLFVLPTTAVFWILLELGASDFTHGPPGQRSAFSRIL